MGLFGGSKLAWRLGFRRVCIECDSSSIVTCINSANAGGADTSNIMMEIFHYLSLDWDVKVDHIYREANMCADWLASWSLHHEFGVHYWDRMLLGLDPLLLADVIGCLPHG